MRSNGPYSRQEARRLALIAAARVAFVASAAGCSTDPPPVAPVVPVPPATPATAASSARTGPDGCTLPSSDTPSEKEASCCLAGATAFVSGHGGMGAADETPDPRAPASIVACCTRMVSFREHVRRSSHYDSCCAVLHTMSGACTPWGPPVPPRMTAHTRTTSVSVPAIT